uniref:Integrase core domain containing protein n=1 Tax=Solanum tuberosum TaxID=4113 RepID=M1DI86_SOLTU
MATLLHYMRPWMQRSVEEYEAHMEQMMDTKIQLTKLWSDVDFLLATAEAAPDPPPMDEANDVVMTALFSDTIPPPYPSHVAGKRHLSSDHTSYIEEAWRAKKREQQRLEAALRQSIIDEELRQHRAREIDVSPSGSKSTTDGVPSIDEGTIDGVPVTDPAGFWENGPTRFLMGHCLVCVIGFASPYVFFVH